jgi:prepilin-type N-terminal cleavage/methylation domain-containing protein
VQQSIFRTRPPRFKSTDGFTLIEVILTIIIAGILAAVALRSVVKLAETAKTEETKQELEELEYAIIGNPVLYNDDTRADFGYVGDVGALPANLDALFTNPGGYASWNGPYVKRRLEQDATDYKVDAWGTNYAFTGGVTITSSGSGSDIVRKFGEATSDFVSNSVDGIILDLNGTPPGTVYKDSISVRLTVPNGTGSFTTLTTPPDNSGFFSFNAVPIGGHDLQIIYQPASDTLKRFVSVLPKSRNYGEYYLSTNVW